MQRTIGDYYLSLVGSDEAARTALLACAAAISLDDRTAIRAVQATTERSESEARRLMHAVKELDCVLREWDGSWYISRDVRRSLRERIAAELPEESATRLRRTLAKCAEERAKHEEGTAGREYRVLQGRVEAAYHRMLLPDLAKQSAEAIVELWQTLPPERADATAEAVDRLADELSDGGNQDLPVEVTFLRGIAARQRGDRNAQKRHFGAVWEHGRPGHIFAVAARIFGSLTDDPPTRLKALNNSLEWDSSPENTRAVFAIDRSMQQLRNSRPLPEIQLSRAASVAKVRKPPLNDQYHAIGRRKTAVARVYLRPGSGTWEINGRTFEDYLPRHVLRQAAARPLAATNTEGRYDVKVTVTGGGLSGQADAIRLGVARALLKINEDFRRELRAEALLTRDPREVERKKPGRAGARKRFQFSKR